MVVLLLLLLLALGACEPQREGRCCCCLAQGGVGEQDGNRRERERERDHDYNNNNYYYYYNNHNVHATGEVHLHGYLMCSQATLHSMRKSGKQACMPPVGFILQFSYQSGNCQSKNKLSITIPFFLLKPGHNSSTFTPLPLLPVTIHVDFVERLKKGKSKRRPQSSSHKDRCVLGMWANSTTG